MHERGDVGRERETENILWGGGEERTVVILSSMQYPKPLTHKTDQGRGHKKRQNGGWGGRREHYVGEGEGERE